MQRRQPLMQEYRLAVSCDQCNVAADIPCCLQPVVAVRFSPVLYCKRPHHVSDNAAFQQPYRMLFALATLDSVAIYDTQVRKGP